MIKAKLEKKEERKKGRKVKAGNGDVFLEGRAQG